MAASEKQGLPPKVLAALLGGVVLLVAGVPLAKLMQKKPVALITSSDSAPPNPDPRPPTPDPSLFDPELYRVPLGMLEDALYGAGGIDRIAEASHGLARSVMAKNVTNPMARNNVVNLETRLNRLAELDTDKAAARAEWEAIRREYFKPASWLHQANTATPARPRDPTH